MSHPLISFPLDCLAGVGEVFGGQYNWPPNVKLTGTPTVLDIGANCGAFTIFARWHFAGCKVFAYEPDPTLFPLLAQNLVSVPNTFPFCAAVGDPDLPKLFKGRGSRLCNSQYDIGEQEAETIPVHVVHPSELPRADIVKLDCEGAEGFVLENLPWRPSLLMVEWHGAEQRRRVEAAIGDSMWLVASSVVLLERGILKYARHDK